MSRFWIAAVLVLGNWAVATAAEPIVCQGDGGGHLQGFDSDGEFIYWSMYDTLIKTDYKGEVVAERPVDPHHGDCCVHDGKVYVATENRVKGRRGLYIYVYNCDDLSPAGEYPIDFPDDGAGGIDGIAFVDGFFYVGEGKKKDSQQEFNWIHKFTPDFTFVEKFKIPGVTTYGIQAMTFAHGSFWLGTYGKDRTYQCDERLKLIAHHPVDVAVGVFGLPKSADGEPRLMVARNIKKDDGRWTASASPAVLKDGKLEWEK